MKKLIIILLLAGSGITGAAAQTMLNVHTTENDAINVSVDGRYFNKRGTSVTVGDLPPGRHMVQVYTMGRDRRGRGVEEMIFEKRIKTFNGMVTLLTVNAYSGTPDIQQQDITTFAANHPPVLHDQDRGNGGGRNFGYKNDNADNNADGQEPAPQQPPAPVMGGTLTDVRASELKTNADAKKTDTEKETLLKSELKNDKLTTTQVGAMMDWLNFESSKVDFAEWAYDRTVDKGSFGDLEARFTYKTYQDEMEKFLQGKK